MSGMAVTERRAAAGLRPESRAGAVPNIGPTYATRLERLGIATVSDLLHHIPRRYEDTRELVALDSLSPGEVQTARVRVTDVGTRTTSKQHMTLIEARLEDDTGTAIAVWFGRKQLFVIEQLARFREVYVSGKVGMSRGRPAFQNPVYEKVIGDQRHVGRLAPVYAETAGVSSRWLRSRIEPLLFLADQVPDAMPPSIRDAEGLLPIGTALRQLHFPATPDEAARARERIAFEERFLMQLATTRARRRRMSQEGIAVPYDVEVARTFAQSLPFTLTDAQRVAAHEILTDLAAKGPMNRLLHGDVGSGKTVVAAMSALMTHRAGYQTAVMAPTEILARQHHATLDALLTPLGLPPRLLVGSTSAGARREIKEGLASGHDALIVGTHALIEEDVVLDNLGLAVVDEQHRFGVAQRQQLRLKARAIPNFLAMTATPIPRSLALTLYGDVDVSELRELPPGRTPVQTRVVPPYDRARAYEFVREQVRTGRQVFVICPIIEESDKLGARSATAEHERLQRKVFPDLRVELLHGRMPSRDKEARMARFARGDADILVATSVVEVGVDVPNATVMVIEGAERFGLAQLHQFRGRVGRGTHASYCLLFEGSTDEHASQRLSAVANTTSGFELAELDLRSRGAGDLVGFRQHGLPEMQVADLLDEALAARTQRAAERWLDEDPELSTYAPLADAMSVYRAVYDLD